jgi:hypothetical protein
VNAPSTGGTVRIDYVSNPYWAKRFDGIRRVASVNRPATPFDTPQLITSARPETPVSKSALAPSTAVAAETLPAENASTAASPNSLATVSRAAPIAAPVAAQVVASPRASTEQERPVEQHRLTEAPADAFEPPPRSRAAAESQAAAEHATTVDPIAAFAGTRDNAPADTARAAYATPASPPPLPVTAAPAAIATPTAVVPAPMPSAGDDPIARFANGG